jgi:hypothetical protein
VDLPREWDPEIAIRMEPQACHLPIHLLPD